MRNFLIGLLLFVVIGSPSYIRSWWLTGDPLYPFGEGDLIAGWSGTLRSDVVESGRVDGRSMLSAFRVYPEQRNWKLLWRVVYEDTAPWAVNNRGFGVPASTIGFIPVVCVIVWLLSVGRGRGRAGAVYMVAGLGFAGVWLFAVGVMEPRYFMLSLPMLCVGMGISINGMVRTHNV